MRNPEEEFFNGKCLQDILEDHYKWVNSFDEGERANLHCADLSGIDLTAANLSRADLSGANLSRADLSGTDLTTANLRGAILTDANLRGAILSGANLNGANLSKIIYDYNTMFFAIQCPEEGSFIGYKKCQKLIVKLEILSDAKRSSATSRKCRCSKAKTLSITNLDGSDSNILAIASNFDPNFIYKIGEVVEVKDFDENRWNECSPGIHYFITRNEAVSY